MVDDHQPLVTIAIPTYNRARTSLPQAMRSALSQTYPNIEVIVSDNCSSDDTEEVVLGFHDPRVRYYRHPANMGPFGNMNFCLQQAAGAYFYQLDDDDLIDPDFVEVCMKAAIGVPQFGIVRTGTRVIMGDRGLTEYPNQAGGLTTQEFFRAWFAGRVQLYQCSTLFNTARLREIGGFSSVPDLLADNTVSVTLASRWGRVDVEEVKATFRQHDGGFGSHVRISEWCRDSLTLLRIVRALVPSNGTQIWREGHRFFAYQNYARAGRAAPGLPRLRAYLTVFRAFGFRYPPPSVTRLIGKIPLYKPVRWLLSGRKRRPAFGVHRPD